MLDSARVKAITLDLDDTLWPIWPTIERAEKVLHDWLAQHAPLTAALFSSPSALRDIRNQLAEQRKDLQHDLSALRRESIRLALQRAGEDPSLAQEAFDVFFAERQRVILFDDVLPGLAFLASRFPLVGLTNGNADLTRVGIDRFFKACVNAKAFGVAKPDPRIFHAAADAAGVPAGQVLHVGDDATLDVLGALGADMQAAWVNRTEAIWPHEALPHIELANLAELCDALQ